MRHSPEMTTDIPSAVPGWILILSTLATIGAVAFHPMGDGNDLAAVLKAIVAGRIRDQLVHGTIIMALVGNVFAILELAARLGPWRRGVRFGVLAYATGSAVEAGAGLLDGFVTPDYAAHLLAAAPDEPRIGLGALILVSLLVQYLTKLGLVLISAGILAFSASLLYPGTGARLAGWLGIPAGLLPVAWLFVTNPVLGPHLLLGIVLLEALWGFAVARILLRSAEGGQ
jgi:hypothetical protein